MNHNKKTIIISAIILLAILITCAVLLSRRDKLITSSRARIEMGTSVSLTVYSKQGIKTESMVREKNSQMIGQVLDRIHELDQFVLSWRSDDSEVRHFNDADTTDPITVSDELADVLDRSLELAQVTKGTMDITLRPLIALWGIEDHISGENYIPPNEEAIQELTPRIGTDHLTLSGNKLQRDDPMIQLDLGAFGKGYALDAALPLLQQTSGAVLSVGGSILTYGSKDEPWQIGIRDPEGGPSNYLGILSIPAEAGKTTFISTSGGYEKYVEADGVIYEHILDGRTLHPAESDLLSVTVITEVNGMISDGLSTACYILGMEASAEILRQYNAKAIFVTREKEIYLSDGLQNQFTLTATGYKTAAVF